MCAHILRGKLQNENFARSIQNILKKPPIQTYHFKGAGFFVFYLKPKKLVVMLHCNNIYPPAK